ncbi:MAG: GspE/PulE family protein [Candidatus Paceibacterota bacterium]
MKFLDFVTQQYNLSDDDLQAIRAQAQELNGDIDGALEKHGLTVAQIRELKEDFYGIPSQAITDETKIPHDTLKYIPEESAHYYRVVPLSAEGGTLTVGIVDPNSIEARDALNFISSKHGLEYAFVVITHQDFLNGIKQYGGLSGEVTEALSDLEVDMTGSISEEDENSVEAPHNRTGELADGGEIKKSDTLSGSEGTIVEDAPVTKIVATILRYATDGGASDVHIEHTRENVRVRFRVDGVLNTSLMLPKKVHAAVVARIKILSNMRLDEKRKPQDGRFSAKIEGRKIDFRVSTFPAYYGEKVVMRILDREKGIRGLDQIQLREPHLKLIKEAMNAPYGMILISGPTGSGKTTTLYAMLDMIDREKKNVLSLEDPVEYNVDGVSQSQVRPDINYTFANGLRTALRQDPDVIMVGEIRDKETAQLAIHAALTGHLVLSTIHTNNAIGIIPRLVDMGVDPYLIAPTLKLGMAQRLVATMCEGAGKPLPIEGSIEAMLKDQFSDLPEQFREMLPKTGTVYEATPTPDCPTGVKGRMAVMEILEMTDEIEEVILRDPSENAIYEVARKQGMLTMKEDAIIKAMEGKTPFKEVNTL